MEMPRLDRGVALEIEQKRLHFTKAGDGLMPKGATFKPISWLRCAAVQAWMDRMKDAFASVGDRMA